jgi:subtilase family serine protease
MPKVRTFICAAVLVFASCDAALATSVAAAPARIGLQDLGRAPASQAVSVAVMLAYRHPDELRQLVAMQSDPSSVYYHRFLTAQQFQNYFAPTAEQERRAIASLVRGGFHISGRFANRTIVDAVASAPVAERYFATEIHQVREAGYGTRYINVRPAQTPADLRGVVESVTGLSNAIYLHTALEPATVSERAAAQRRASAMMPPVGDTVGTRIRNFVRPALSARASTIAPATSGTGNEILDPGFESGTFNPWQICAEYNATDPAITNAKAHTGTYSAIAGSTSTGEITEDAGVCESVTIPTSGVLTFWVNQLSTETNTDNAFQEADLIDGDGERVVQFYKTVATTNGWKKLTFDVSKYAGQRYFFYAGVQGSGSKTLRTYQYLDDVSLTGTGYPTTGPSIGGPLLGPDGGFGPAVVATSYDFPVQHGYGGAGRATGVAISGDYSDPDLGTFLDEFGINRGAETERVEVDGGAPFTAGGSSSEEATLDVETIVSLAPSTRLYMYLIPELSDADVIDDYNQVVSDDIVDVLNSSFGACETDDPTYDQDVEKVAEQGASEGITFSASSGDDGSAVCGGKTGVQSPASNPYVVGVGGTSIAPTNTGGYGKETAWSGSGGGVSVEWAVPSYQSGYPGVVGKTRNVPDIAFPADPSTGTSFFFSGEWAGPIGGTSWASPIFSALLTETDQRQKSRAGYVNPTLYSIHTKDGSSAFHDITSGSNGAYKAHSGYDNVTGLGSIKGFYFSGVE